MRHAIDLHCNHVVAGAPRRSLPVRTGLSIKLRHLKRALEASLAPLLLASCASTQVNYNTLDIASTYDLLITKQVTYNIRKSYEDKYGLPSFTKVTAQTATTQDTITPSVTTPLAAQITWVNQITRAATGVTGQGSRTSQLAGSGASLQAAAQWQQAYTLTPIYDTGELRRLRVLYQYVTKQLPTGGIKDPDKELESTYPLIEAGASTTGAAQGSATKTSLKITVDGKPVTVEQTQSASPKESSPIYVRRAYLFSPDGRSFLGYTWVKVNPDVTFIQQPGCILCDYSRHLTDDELKYVDANLKKNSSRVVKLEKNVDLRDDWLYAPGEPLASDAIALPSNGMDTLYLKRVCCNDPDPDGGRKYFYEFALFNQDAASLGTGTAASSGQSDGRKVSPLQRVSIPVGGILTNP
jgi:hypothetical protein